MACWLRIPCGHCYGLGFIPGPGIFTLPHAVGAAKKKKKKKKEEMLELTREDHEMKSVRQRAQRPSGM